MALIEWTQEKYAYLAYTLLLGTKKYPLISLGRRIEEKKEVQETIYESINRTLHKDYRGYGLHLKFVWERAHSDFLDVLYEVYHRSHVSSDLLYLSYTTHTGKICTFPVYFVGELRTQPVQRDDSMVWWYDISMQLRSMHCVDKQTGVGYVHSI